MNSLISLCAISRKPPHGRVRFSLTTVSPAPARDAVARDNAALIGDCTVRLGSLPLRVIPDGHRRIAAQEGRKLSGCPGEPVGSGDEQLLF